MPVNNSVNCSVTYIYRPVQCISTDVLVCVHIVTILHFEPQLLLPTDEVEHDFQLNWSVFCRSGYINAHRIFGHLLCTPRHVYFLFHVSIVTRIPGIVRQQGKESLIAAGWIALYFPECCKADVCS